MTDVPVTTFAATVAAMVIGLPVQLGGPSPRTLNDWASDTINVRAYAARCDGVTDDTLALRAAFAAAAVVPGGIGLDMPRGRCRYEGDIAQAIGAGQAIRLRGPGSFVTSTGAGISITLTAPDAGFDAEGVGFYRTGAGQAGTALSVTATVTQAITIGRFRDLTFAGNTATGGTAQWLVGLKLTGVSAPVIDGMRSLMANGNGNAAGVGLWLFGTDKDHYLTDAKVNASVFQGGSIGIAASGAFQGLFVSNSEALGNDYGIHAAEANTALLPEAVMVSNSHFNNVRAGIHLGRTTQSQITNSLFLHFLPESTLPYRAIEADQSGYLVVQGNGLVGAGTQAPGGETFVRVTGGGQLHTITGNNVVNLSGLCIDAQTEANTLATGNSCQAVSAPGIVLGATSRATANIVNGQNQ